MEGVLVVSSFESRLAPANEHSAVEVHLSKQVYTPGDEIAATVQLSVSQTIVNVTGISWQLFGAEMLERSEGYLSRHVVTDQSEFLVGSQEDTEKESAPDVATKTHIFEPDPYHWEVRATLPPTCPPTFRTATARIEYFFAVTVHLKGEEPLQHKLLVPVASDFPPDIEKDERVRQVEAGELAAGGLVNRWFSAPTKMIIVADADRFHHCPYGMIKPAIPVHATLSSLCTEIITEVEVELSRRTVLHHRDQDVTELSTISQATLALIPPLVPNVTQEYYLQVPVSADGEEFVNPSRFSSRCIFNETYVTLSIRNISTKFCVCISTYNPNPISRQPSIESQADKSKVAAPKQAAPRLSSDQVAEWGVAEVATWLEVNRLADHAAAFAEQSIDGAALLALEEQHFAALGVSLLGDSIKLKSALESISR